MRFPENAISAAAFHFEKSNGSQLSEFEASEIERHGLSEIDPELVAKELRAAVHDNYKTDSTYRQQAYWALGKRFDSALIPFLRERLQLELRRDLIAVYEIMIALDNLEEPVFSNLRDCSVAMHEYELNRKDAEAYLDALPKRKRAEQDEDGKASPAIS